MRRLLVLAVSLCAVTLAASCSGGGGSGSGGGLVPVGGAPYVQATPNPSLAAAPSSLCGNIANSRVVSIDSNPRGAWVEITSLGVTYLLGQTPQSCQLSPSATGVTVTVLGAVGQTPQSTAVAGNASTTIYFNALGDSSGSATASSGVLTSAMRAPASAAQGGALRAPRRALGRPAASGGVVPGVFSVVYRPGALAMEGLRAADVERTLGVAGAAIGSFKGLEWRSVHAAAAQAATVEAQLKARPDVAAVYPAHYRRRLAIRPQDAAVMPNDAYMDPYDQWDMFRIGMPAAWGISQGSSSAPIAIIDTGYDVNNVDVAPKVTYSEVDLGPCGTTSATPCTTDGGGLLVASPPVEDTDGHGSNVSGIAAATTNAGAFAGVGWSTPLLEFKIFPDEAADHVACVDATTPTDLNECSATTTDEAAAIDSAVRHGAKVISMSLGGPAGQAPDPTEYAAVEQAISQGVVVVAAAGNDGSSTGISYPGGYRGVISVGASAIHGDTCTSGTASSCDPASGSEGLASYSNYGLTADAPTNPNLVMQPTLLAPGGDPSSTSDLDNLHWIFNLYSTGDAQVTSNQNDLCAPANTSNVCSSFMAGTSQATPHVSGAVALMLSISPGLTPAQVLAIFQNGNNDDNLGVAGQGAGRLDVVKALQAAGGSVAAPSGLPASSLVVFAYTPGPNDQPIILDKEYPNGAPVDANGSFRLSDLPPNLTYEVGVWIDTNHDGMVDAGDWFGAAGGTASPSQFSSNSAYSAIAVTVQQVGSTFTLH